MAFLTFILIILVFLFCTDSLAVQDSITPFKSMSDGSTLVSKEGSFELGFFSPGSNLKNRYLGIWYKNIPVRTVVWVANRCNPINGSSGMLTINNTGNLVLLDQNKSVVWSTRVSKQAKKPKVELLDSGNLVLGEEEDTNSENYFWQSFDYPTDTLLPYMKLGWDLRIGLNRRLSAWKNWDDPCTSDFTRGIEFDQLHRFPEAVMRKGTEELSRTGPWNGQSFSGNPDLRPNPIFNYKFVDNDDEIYYSYSLKNKSVISIMVLNSSSTTRSRLTWIESEQKWKAYYSYPRDYCDTYGLCGANGDCIITTSPVCQCLKGFKPRSQERWDSMDWSQGCVREHPLSCQMGENKDGFLKFSGMKVPDTKHAWANKSMNIEECKEKCLSNCSCMAYAEEDIRGDGSGCIIWFGDLIDIRTFPAGGQDLYIRTPDSELGNNEQRRSHGKVKAIVIVVSVSGSVSVMILFGFCIWKRRSFRERTKTSQNEGKEEDLELPLFTLSTITTATNSFSENNKLGQGGFGPVYRGILEDGQEIAVKRLSISSGQGVNEFKNEVKLIAKLQHRNLVKLLGCCIEGEEKLLVYEYMPNKSLDFFIFDETQGKLLDWQKRFQIICGIARGLLYLHHDSRLRIVHRDLKASNVLLDKEMNPKISDFGMAKTFGGDQTEGNTNRVVGTFGYMAPEYALSGQFSTKSDIFSFGIMVLEIVSGKKSTAFQHENQGHTLIGHAWTLLKEGRPFELIEVWLRDSYDNVQEVLHCIHVGLLCVQQNPVDRPTMSSVVFMLGSENIVLPPPKPPGYFTETQPLEIQYSSSINTTAVTTMEAR